MRGFIRAIIALGLMKYAYDVSDIEFAAEDFEHRPKQPAKKA